MSAQSVLALCLIAVAVFISPTFDGALPSSKPTPLSRQGSEGTLVATQQILTDKKGEERDSPFWEDYQQEDIKYYQIPSPAGAGPILPPPYEIVEVKPLSDGVAGRSDQLLYSITIKGKPLTISLQKQIFLSSDFQVFIDDKVETWLSKFMMSMGDCYYSGQVLESNGSSVSLRTCFGLRGIIEFVNGSFIIEPLQKTSGFLHLIYKMEASEEAPIIIFENDTNLRHHTDQHRVSKPLKTLHKMKSSIFSMRRYIKVSLFVTVEAYKVLGGSPKTVITTLLQVFTYINTKFAPLKLEIFLSSVDLWIESNLCVIADNVSDTLENFIEWLSGLPSNPRSFNIPLLIVGGQPSGVGKTYFEQMCSNNNGAVLTFPRGLSLEKFSSLISHILGHNVGMLHHDSMECTCPVSPCIMDADMMMGANSKSFSDCSLMEFQNFIMRTGASCLLTHPNTKPLVDPSLCGNRVLDKGESCDCGTEAECKKDPCCDYKTCTLKPGAKCASGACCSKCQFLPSGTLCRKKADECDVHEYCSGATAACPEDVFQQNGNPCNDEKSVCYNGKCQNVDLQCVQFFGPASINADLECYQKQNVIGDRFGNCGGVKGFYGSCEPQDVLCGKCHCMIVDGEAIFRPDMAIAYYTSKHHICLTGDFLTEHFIDPFWVKDGTKCGKNKICINKKCTHISRSEAACKRETTCNGHGVCNNKHKCHCDAGWSPPFCNRSGDFGKLDSRTMADDTGENSGKCSSRADIYLRSWLLLVFLLVLPLMVIILISCKRNVLQKFLHIADEESTPNSGGEESNTSEMNTEVGK